MQLLKLKNYLLTVMLLIPLSTLAHGNDADNEQTVIRQMLLSTALPNVADHKLTRLTVELKPGIEVGEHQHDAFVFVYVLEGIVGSQLNGEDLIEYKAGDTWMELPGDNHSLTKNMSHSESAKILVVFVAKEGAKLTNTDKFD